MENIKLRTGNTLIAILWLIVFSSCDNLKTFELNSNIISSIENNDNCSKLLNIGFGVNHKKIVEVGYIQNLLNRIIKENKDIKYTRFIFLKIYEEGEVVSISKVTVGSLDNGKGLLKNYHSDKTNSKKIDNINLDLFYEKIGKPKNKIANGRSKVLIIDFRNISDFNCYLYDDLNNNIIKKLKNLTIFN